MADARSCPHCGASLDRLDKDCPACGQRTGQRLPFYVYLLGAAIVLLLFLAFGDFGALVQVLVNLAHMLRS